MTYNLRRATAADQPSIRALVLRVRINPRGLDWRRFWVAAAPDGRVVGCGQIKPHRDGSFELASIGVLPEYQGQGMGRALVEKLLDGSPRPLYLTCRARMEPFYQKFGFREVRPEEVPPSFHLTWRLFSFLKGWFPPSNQGRIMIKQ